MRRAGPRPQPPLRHDRFSGNPRQAEANVINVAPREAQVQLTQPIGFRRCDTRWRGVLETALAILVFIAVSPSLMAGRRTEPFQTPTAPELTLDRVALAPGAPAVILTWTRHRDDEGAFEAEHVRMLNEVEELIASLRVVSGTTLAADSHWP